jgi:hypothetical protein
VHRAALLVDLGADQLAAALQEVAPVGLGVEADDVVRQDSGVELLADARRQYPPGVGLGPGNVDEVVQEGVGTSAAHQLGQRVEVVVVDHHDRLLDLRDLLDHGPRQVFVDDVVAELEGLDLVATDVRRVREVPEVVLDEPQHRVREDVVEAVVGVRRGLDEPHQVLAAGRRAHLERAPAVAARGGRVVLAHRRCDPDHLAVGRQSAQRRHQAAAAALHRAVGFEGDGAPVRDQHQAAALAVHAPARPVVLRRAGPRASIDATSLEPSAVCIAIAS